MLLVSDNTPEFNYLSSFTAHFLSELNYSDLKINLLFLMHCFYSYFYPDYLLKNIFVCLLRKLINQKILKCVVDYCCVGVSTVVSEKNYGMANDYAHTSVSVSIVSFELNFTSTPTYVYANLTTSFLSIDYNLDRYACRKLVQTPEFSIKLNDRIDQEGEFLGSGDDVLVQECRSAVQECHAAVQERRTAVQECRILGQEGGTAVLERDIAVQERDTAVQERDTAVQERDAAVQECRILGQERGTAVQEHYALRQEISVPEQEINALNKAYGASDQLFTEFTDADYYYILAKNLPCSA